ncbi:DUF7344 domain-containing protein [Haloterrigena alkaliphila]|nr:ArsR family transcriptional regulator [Haloterrigena alkaliphila]QSW99389.2 ArsR family transcriptional regulator [Haloterrigena alkaliphila]
MGERRDDRGGNPLVPDGSGADLSLNAILEVMAHHHRREILRVLVDSPDHTASIDELMNHVSDLEVARTGQRPGRDQLEIAFHHVHLPALTDVGLLEYDARSKDVRYRRHERVEDLLEYLDSISE